MKKLILIFSFMSLFIPSSRAFAYENHSRRCIVAWEHLNGENKAAVTDTAYLQLALDIYKAPGPFLYVMSKIHPYHGKAYFVESLNSACRVLNLSLRADDGARAYLTMTPSECFGDCRRLNTNAVIRWEDRQHTMHLENLEFGFTWDVRFFGDPVGRYVVRKPASKIQAIEALVLTASHDICKIQMGNDQSDRYAKCVAERSGQSTVEYYRKVAKEGAAP